VTIELARLLKFDPVPIIIAEIFAANVGGSATMAGDPPNIIIGTALGYSFSDFLVNTGVIAWVGMVVAIVFFYLVSGRPLKHLKVKRKLTRVNILRQRKPSRTLDCLSFSF